MTNEEQLMTCDECGCHTSEGVSVTRVKTGLGQTITRCSNHHTPETKYGADEIGRLPSYCDESEAVSASPQPRCPKCGNNQLRIDFNVTDGGKNRRHYVVCKTGEDCGYRAWVDDLSQFFAAAPAQERDTRLLEDCAMLLAEPWLEFGPNTPPMEGEYQVSIKDNQRYFTYEKAYPFMDWKDGKWLWDSGDGDPLQDFTDEVTHYRAAPQPVSGDAPKVEALKADNLFGVYCGGNPESAPKDRAIYWEGWQRVADYLNRLRPYFPPASQTPKSVTEAATELLNAMETCHICHSYLILQEFPVHCEDCSSDCENHDGGECTPIYILHAKLRKILEFATPASTARIDYAKWSREWFEFRKLTPQDFYVPDMLKDFHAALEGGVPQAEPPKEDVKEVEFTGSWLDMAICVAVKAHAGQLDKSRKPYILHPLRVMAAVAQEGEAAMIAAVLHDAVEDTELSLESVKEQFGDEVASMVDSLSRRKSKETYREFIQRVKLNPMAAKIKIADLHDNLSRIENLAPNEQSIRHRYEKALIELAGAAQPGDDNRDKKERQEP